MDRGAVHDRIRGTGIGHVQGEIDAGAAAREELVDGGHVRRQLPALQQPWVEQHGNPVGGQPDIALDAAAQCCRATKGRKGVLLRMEPGTPPVGEGDRRLRPGSLRPDRGWGALRRQDDAVPAASRAARSSRLTSPSRLVPIDLGSYPAMAGSMARGP
jgi:hypothetical protein